MTRPLLWLKLILVAGSVLVAWLPLGHTASVGVFVVLLLAAGLPHGALDHVLFRNQSGATGVRLHVQFYGYYFLCIGIFACVWWLAPAVALLGFLAVSGYHFGQTQLAHLGAQRWLWFAWGAWVLATLVYTHPESLKWGFVDVLPGYSTEVLHTLFGYLSLGLGGLAAGGLVATQLPRGALWPLAMEWLEMGAIVLLFSTTNFFVSFGVFFGGWHALRAVQNLRSELRAATTENVSLPKLMREAMPHTLASLLGIGLMAGLAYIFQAHRAALLLFVGLSVVALPHIVTVERWHRYRAAVKSLPMNPARTPML